LVADLGIEIALTVIATALSHVSFGTHLEIELLKQLGLVCGAGLLMSIILMAHGLNLSAGDGYSVVPN
jgi:hypothetical protein